MSNEEHYIIWSEEHGAWWGKARRGYTRQLAKAGRYSKTEADEIVADANKYLQSPLPFNDVAFPDTTKDAIRRW